MLRSLAALLFLLFAPAVSAQSCPDFFRFVDFGLKVGDGTFVRGGPLYRAESLAGSPLLLRDLTQCRDVTDIAKDGHGNPIPVVTRIDYAPDNTGIALSTLQVSYVQDVQAAAEANAAAHRAALGGSAATQTKGPDFLCAALAGSPAISCQVVSPYPGDMALVVYCDAGRCEMPVLAVRDTIQVAAIWPVDATFARDPAAAGAAIQSKVRQIFDFLDPLS